MKQTVRSVFAAILYFAVLSLSLCYAVPPCTFGGLDINNSDNLLFSISQEYKSLFMAHLTPTGLESGYKKLTCYPEKIDSLNFYNSLLIRNQYGVALYSNSVNELKWISDTADLRTLAFSYDGKWVCYVSKEFPNAGQLILENIITREKKVLVEKISIETDRVNVKWSPDSSFLIYEKGSYIYFINPELAFKNISLNEEYRKIGKGTIRNIEWAKNKSLLYIDGDIIYRMQESELYIKGLYSSFVENGCVIGRLLYSFDSAQDCFWCNESGNQIVINTGNKFITYCTINEKKYDFVQPVVQQPLSIVPGAPLECTVFWQNDSSPVLWVDYISFGSEEKESCVYSLYDKVHLITAAKDSINPVCSPEGKYVAFSNGSEFLIYSLDGWKEVISVKGQEIVSACWNGSSSIFIGGKETVNYMEFVERDYAVAEKEKVMFLSSSYKAYWKNNSVVAYTSLNSPAYIFNSDKNTWAIDDTPLSAHMSQSNNNFRVFIGEADNKDYTNAVYIRTLDSRAFTYPLDGKTQRISPVSKKAAIVFDAVGDARGLGRILYTLKKYDVAGTFFINGEFIQRYPLETKLLSDSGNICASMFFCNVDLLASNYKIDKDFVRQGLARNEDDFYMITGRELSLLWHAPFNKYNQYIKEAGLESGYLYVDINKIDDDCLVIPMSVGTADRDLETVIVSLINDGYEFVSLFDFIEKSNCISE